MAPDFYGKRLAGNRQTVGRSDRGSKTFRIQRMRTSECNAVIVLPKQSALPKPPAVGHSTPAIGSHDSCSRRDEAIPWRNAAIGYERSDSRVRAIGKSASLQSCSLRLSRFEILQQRFGRLPLKPVAHGAVVVGPGLFAVAHGQMRPIADDVGVERGGLEPNDGR